MAYPGYQNSLLLSQFREFYSELARLKEAVLPRGLPQQTMQVASAEEVWRRLLSLLETQSSRASRSGGAFGFQVYREAQYVMAAVADEVFLNQDWPGRRNWPLLEIPLFQSHEAGELIFKKIDLLLLHRDPVYVDLAAVYFFALSLGFQGKYRRDDPGNDIDNYKRRLFSLIFRQDPRLLQQTAPIFKESYSHTLSDAKAIKLPHPRKWVLAFLGIILVWLAVSHFLWINVSGPVREGLSNIKKVTQNEGQRPGGGHK
jgi:type VI secretion system protein ImpK